MTATPRDPAPRDGGRLPAKAMKSPSVPASPSVQGVRPTPRELAEQLRQRLDTESDTALLTAAITRDREQGRAEEAALREALKQPEAMHTFYCRVGPKDQCLNCGRRYLEHVLPSMCPAAPLAPATTGTEPTK